MLVNDKNEMVREAVAKQGYGLDILANDKDFGVRYTVALIQEDIQKTKKSEVKAYEKLYER